ncbi:N-acetylgalactosaminyltransferase 7 [Amphibalanus amphitrite]|uniref:Polypeptide N-acetylgalactosaminyltransferase n=2 Tax=Amphibalanus amphitrite TaxID=1232801 RepID=A0A6A4XI04_AMPAM|nr:N-acetylgalactosaminyltransferase 7 [Amphibalanus amphitrite]
MESPSITANAAAPFTGRLCRVLAAGGRMSLVMLRRGRVLKLTAVVLCLVLIILFLLPGDRRGQLLEPSIQARVSKLTSGRVVSPPVYNANKPGNYEPPPERERTGPGENGQPHRVSRAKQNLAAQSENEYGMNMAVSDEISLDRSVPDTRDPECKHWDYPEDLPSTSVIIVFHNEGWSTLMRTVHSVVNGSPAKLLHEIILVDDFSDKEDLKEKLVTHIRQFDGRVKLHRNTEREGLIRTRTRGAQLATGEVIVFLDAHCEVNANWLPPLLAPIALDRTRMTVPIIDGVDHSTFEYRPVYQWTSRFRGIFEWGMLYKENDIPEQESKQHAHRSEPYRAPTHAGGLFAIDRSYFLELGAYDPGLLVWGGENFELSFKIWQCGGSIVWVPCSRVGHVYRGFMPYSFGELAKKKKGPLITINYKRVIETWFDEKHKEFFYTREPMARFLDHGDISEQLAFKERNKCKSFQWFMDNVAYDVVEKFPELPPNIHWGELRNSADGRCLDTMGQPAPTNMGVSPCHGYGNNQLIRLNSAGQLAVGERCVEADGHTVKLAFCRLGTVDGHWQYSETSQSMFHRRLKKCMALDPGSGQLKMLDCDERDSYKKWQWKQLTPRW